MTIGRCLHTSTCRRNIWLQTRLWQNTSVWLTTGDLECAPFIQALDLDIPRVAQRALSMAFRHCNRATVVRCTSGQVIIDSILGNKAFIVFQSAPRQPKDASIMIARNTRSSSMHFWIALDLTSRCFNCPHKILCLARLQVAISMLSSSIENPCHSFSTRCSRYNQQRSIILP